MSLFEKAKPKDRRLKMYIYGKTGTGKTVTALHFPSPAVIDAEKGTEHYADTFDFYRVPSSDPKKLHEALDELLLDPGEFKTLVVDPFSVIYDRILRNKQDQMKERTGDIHYELEPLDYKSIKTEVKIIMDKLLSLDMNVIVTARSKPLYAKDKFMEQIGEQPDGHKDMPYMFDVVLELSKDQDGTRFAKVEKDRTNKLPHEFEFTYDAFVEYIGLDSLTRSADASTQKENMNDRRNRTTKITYEGDELYTAGVNAKTLGALTNILEGVDEDELVELLKEDYGVESLLDLNNIKSKSLLSFLEKAKEAEN